MQQADNFIAGAPQHADSMGAVATKAAPAVAYLGAKFAGLSLPDWAALLAIVYTLCMLAQTSWRFGWWVHRNWKRWRAARS